MPTVSGAQFLSGVCLTVTLLIVDLWQYCACCIRAGITRCTLLMVLFLDRMCQCGLHVLPWSYIGTLMRPLTVEPRSIARFLFPSQCPTGKILLTPYSMVWDWLVSRARPMIFISLSCYIPTIIFYYFSLSLLSVYRLVSWG